MKKTISCLLICSLMLLATGCAAFSSPVYYPLLDEELTASFMSYETSRRLTEADLGLENMEIVAEDQTAILYLNPKTTEIAVQRKSTGHVWFSNPQDRIDSSDALINAQFIVTTLNRRDVAKLWNTFDDSVAYGQFNIDLIDQGANVTYLMGKVQEEVLYPAGMTEDGFAVLLDRLESDSDRSYLKRMYGFVNLESISSGQQRENLKNSFSKLETELDGIMYVLKSQLSRLEQKNLSSALQNAGYTLEDRMMDEESVGYIGGTGGRENFVFSVQYQLENGSLIVDIDPAQIKATDKLKISQITAFRNFGALSPGQNGYLFVPDGSGAIIDAKTVRSTVWSVYNRKVYGQDFGILRTDRVDYSEQTYLPVFGAYHDQGGFLGIAENGDGQMSIIANAANQTTGYSYVCPDFTLLSYALVSLESSAENALNIYPRKAVVEPISLRYLFCDTIGASYDDLAVMYRDYLLERGQIDGVNDREGLVVAVNAIGAIDEIKSVFGYPAQVVKVLTTMDEIRELGHLMSDEVPDGDLVINYTGWQKGGIMTGYLKTPQTESKLGSNRRLSELSSDLESLGVALLPVVELQYCYDSNWLKGFRPLNHAIRFITRDTGYKPEHNIANFYLDDKGLKPYIIRPGLVVENTDIYMRKYKTLNMTGIGLGAIASEVYSDYRHNEVLSVNDTIRSFQEAISIARDQNELISGYGANVYALSGLDYALGVPVTSSNHPIISRSVPFLQIVLSGSVSYTMPALNQAHDYDFYLLKAIETGSGVYFDYFADDGTAIIQTKYDQLYGAAHASIWPKASILAYETTSVLQSVANRKITGHEQLDDGVFQTIYDNDIVVIVNYNAEAWQEVPARGYHLSANDSSGGE